MRQRPSLADYLANPDAFPEIALATRRPVGRSLPATDYDAQVALRGLMGRRTYRYHPPSRETDLPPGPPEWTRRLPRYTPPPVTPMAKPGRLGQAIGPGGVLTAPPAAPLPAAGLPAPTHYRSMGEAQLADAMLMQPMTPLPEALALMPMPSGLAPGTQANGMRVPPVPASFGESRNDGLTDADWRRALSSVRRQEETYQIGRSLPRPGNPAIAGLFGPNMSGSRSARR